MAILENRVKAAENSKLIRRLTRLIKQSLSLVLICLSIYLLYFLNTKSLSLPLVETTGRIALVINSFSYQISNAINLVGKSFNNARDLEAENIKLKLEVARLKNLQSDIQSIRTENSSLRGLLKVVEDKPWDYTTVRLLSLSSNLFGKLVIVDGGIKDNVKVDQVVLCSEGLLGKVVEVSNNFSKVMLITDLNSRIPVMTLGSRERGILVGDVSKAKMIYLNEGHEVQQGEMIVTSGDGKLYPSGIPVAEVTEVFPDYVLAKPVAGLKGVEFVSIMASVEQKFGVE
jgi:rod shape-determining protein MreC